MRITGNEPINLTGFLLVALPTLRDPNFRRTILFLIKHSPSEGAMGVILNRPQESNLQDLGAALGASLPSGLGAVRVFEGGPVEKHQLILARMIVTGTATSFESIGEKFGEDFPSDLSKDELRAFVGYAGWERQQLEREIDEKSWITLPTTPALLAMAKSRRAGEDLWLGIMKSLGPWHHLMAIAPDDLSLN